jgi:thiamine pyrophosphate-dependent acetolactate synthase large subunit-like protein
MTVSQADQEPTPQTGGNIISKMLAAEGVKTVFGIADAPFPHFAPHLKKTASN